MNIWAFAAEVLILGAWLFWLTYDRANLRDALDKAVDDADDALARVNRVINHLAETEPAPTGRHAHDRP